MLDDEKVAVTEHESHAAGGGEQALDAQADRIFCVGLVRDLTNGDRA